MTVLEQRYMETYIRRANEKSENEKKIIALLKEINTKLENILNR
jgi:hypothetical protein